MKQCCRARRRQCGVAARTALGRCSGATATRRSQSPLSPAASGIAQPMRHPHSHESERHGSSRHAQSGSPQSPTLQAGSHATHGGDTHAGDRYAWPGLCMMLAPVILCGVKLCCRMGDILQSDTA